MSKAKKKRRRRKSKDVFSQIVFQVLPIIIVTSIGEVFAGSIMSKMHHRLDLIPGLIILVPAIMDMRGNIGTALGSRLSSSLHLGLVSKRFSFNRLNVNNIGGAFLLSLIVAVVVGLVSRLACYLLGLPSISLINLLFIALLASIMASLVLVPFTTFITYLAYDKKLNPDNIVAPMVGMVGDVITVVMIFVAADIVLRFKLDESWSLLILPFIPLMARRLPSRYRFMVILKQSVPILIFCALLGIFAGVFLHWQYSKFLAIPGLLILVPQIIAKSGSIGGVFGARFSSAFHLGLLRPYKINKYVLKNFLAALTIALFISPSVAIITKFGAMLFKIAMVPFLPLLLISFFTIFIITLVVFIIDFITASFSYSVKIDPSNSVIPLVTSLGDIIGTVVLVLAIAIIL